MPISPPIGQNHFLPTLPVPSPISNGSGLAGVPRCNSVKQLPVWSIAALCTKRALPRFDTTPLWSSSPDGATIAITSHDFEVIVLDAESGSQLHAFPGPTTVLDVAYTPDNELLVATYDNGSVA